MTLFIRPAIHVDIPFIQQVARESWHATYDSIFSREFIDDFLNNAYSDRALRHSVDGANTLLLLATTNKTNNETSDGVIGSGEIAQKTYRDDRSGAELYRLYVAPQQWGQGAGTALLDRLEAWLYELNVDRYVCFVHGENEIGKRFYARRGFVHEPSGDRDGEWLMVKQIS